MSTVANDVLAASRIPFARTLIVDEAQQAVARVLASGWVTTGPEVVEFESELAALVGAPHAVAVSSCTAGIELSLRALRLPRGAKVLCPTITFASVAHVIINAGYEPILVDVNPITLMPDVDTTAAAVRAARGVDAMIVLHFTGHPAPVRDLAEAAELPLTRVIEDAAHALGTYLDDHRLVGALSAATCFSFYATKNLPIGEGGMITTADEHMAEFARRSRLHGMSRDAWKRYAPGSHWRYEITQVGLKANMTDIQAAIGRAQLPHFPSWQRRREQIVERYDECLTSIDGLLAPARPLVGRHAWHLYVTRVTHAFGISREEFIAGLSERGVDCSVHFIPLHHQPYFKDHFRARAYHLPNADAAFQEIVSLPLYPGLTDSEVEKVCAAIEELSSSVPRSRKPRRSNVRARRRTRTIVLEP